MKVWISIPYESENRRKNLRSSLSSPAPRSLLNVGISPCFSYFLFYINHHTYSPEGQKKA